MSVLAAIERALAASLKTPGFRVTETHGRLIGVGCFDASSRPLWTDAFATRPDWLTLACQDEVGADKEPADIGDDEIARVTLSFDVKPGAIHLFSGEGWKIYLKNANHDFNASVVRLAFVSDRFRTDAFAVEPWTDAPAGAAVRSQTEPNPRRFVRCTDANLLAPAELAPWLLQGEPPKASFVAFDIWRNASSEMIARTLVNELATDAYGPKVILSGQPPKKLDFGSVDPHDALFFDTINLAVRWIYGGQHDHEIKHTFLTAELAREWPTTEPFCKGLSARIPNALESAQLLYKAHIRSGSKETLKALADLRKVLADEVQKISQQTRDLANGVWKDVAIAVGTLSLKLLTDAAKTPGFKTGIAYVSLAVALYIAVSFWMSLRTNSHFQKVTSEIRNTWRTKLYGFLDDGDYKALATVPLDKAEAAYASTKRWTTAIVTIVVFGLVAHAAWDLGWIEYRSSP